MILRWVAALTCLLLAAPRALAAEPDIAIQGCVDVDPADFARLLDIELRTLDANLDRLSRLDLACHGEQVEVVATWPDRPITRAELNVSQTERQAVTRLLALRVSELLTSTTAPGPVTIAAKPTVLAPESPPAPPPREPRYSASLGPTLRSLGKPRALLVGIALGATLKARSHLTLKVDLGFDLGQARASEADVAFRQLSTSAAALMSTRLGAFDVGAGPGFRASYLWLSAHDTQPGTRPQRLNAPWAGPLVTARVALHSKPPWLVALETEAGWVTLPVQGLIDGKERLLTIDGPWLGVQGSVAYEW